MTDLVGENGGKAHCQVSQVTVVLVVKRFGKHVRRSEAKYEVALGQRFHGFPAAFQIQASFPNGANDHARRAASKLHALRLLVGLSLTQTDRLCDSIQGSDEIFNHAVGFWMVGIESGKFSV